MDDRREGGRLARAGRTGDEYETARTVADVFDDCRQTELAEAEDLVGNLAVDGGGGAALIEDVGAEAGQPFDAEREVELQVLLEAMLLRIGERPLLGAGEGKPGFEFHDVTAAVARDQRERVGEDRVGELFRLRRSEHRHVERRELAVDANLRGGVGRDVQIRAAALDHRFQKLMKGDWHSVLR